MDWIALIENVRKNAIPRIDHHMTAKRNPETKLPVIFSSLGVQYWGSCVCCTKALGCFKSEKVVEAELSHYERLQVRHYNEINQRERTRSDDGPFRQRANEDTSQ